MYLETQRKEHQKIKHFKKNLGSNYKNNIWGFSRKDHGKYK